MIVCIFRPFFHFYLFTYLLTHLPTYLLTYLLMWLSRSPLLMAAFGEIQPSKMDGDHETEILVGCMQLLSTAY